MIVLAKLIIGLTLFIIPRLDTQKEPLEEYALLNLSRITVMDSAKVKAYRILDTKYNICHNWRNQIRVFTLENMNPWAGDIYKQVFIKKRMPKGKKIKLTNKEYHNLLRWITSTKKQ